MLEDKEQRRKETAGCEASLLLDDANGKDSEKNGQSNLSTYGYVVIDDIKILLENACPDVVSLNKFYLINLQDGGPTWQVQLGRRDSRMANINGNGAIPKPRETLCEISQKFRDQGLDSTDLVALSGAHTFGSARCIVFSHCLYNFSGTGKPDPSLDPKYSRSLRGRCPDENSSFLNELDPTTPNGFDNNYFTNLKRNFGLLQTDQELFSSTPGAETVAIVERFAENQSDFFESFGKSMIKMGNIKTLTGSNCEIRLNCGKVN
ncbi:hypothetical protein Patl1_29916 [Pistacia atlantica]|uniref:Uncharacterized protein n=1 Tax=Pistacia atlantica TaxID=434234 RepID=A0ACC1ADE7_9ROSI|nr:hypothetical protein Patl1_29916 [Pistacia atlantica]